MIDEAPSPPTAWTRLNEAVLRYLKQLRAEGLTVNTERPGRHGMLTLWGLASWGEAWLELRPCLPLAARLRSIPANLDWFKERGEKKDVEIFSYARHMSAFLLEALECARGPLTTGEMTNQLIRIIKPPIVIHEPVPLDEGMHYGDHKGLSSLEILIQRQDEDERREMLRIVHSELNPRDAEFLDRLLRGETREQIMGAMGLHGRNTFNNKKVQIQNLYLKIVKKRGYHHDCQSF
jgi:hypothetical protein